MLKFPSIEAFKSVVHTVRKQAHFHGITNLPTVSYIGRVKLHGTNAGISLDFVNRTATAQSRERVLSVMSDNYGFAAWVHSKKDELLDYFEFLRLSDDPKWSVVTLFGEWIGTGIQKNVAISKIEGRRFVVFAHAYDNKMVEKDDGRQDYLLNGFYGNPYGAPDGVEFMGRCSSQFLDIDFNKPEEAVPTLERLTAEYEARCPFGASMGVEGIGEGLVWSPAVDIEFIPDSRALWFKTKGEKHGNPGTTNTVRVDTIAQRIDDFNELLTKVLPEWRLEQGFEALGDSPSRKQTGQFISWVIGDIHKEELDTIVASGFEWKPLANRLTTHIREWFFKKV